MANERRARWLAEFFLIVLGILTALAVDDWKQGREDRALERYILAGVREDLRRDTTDSGGAIRAAEGRAAAADELLRLTGDPVAGKIPPMDRNLDQGLNTVRARYPTGSLSARAALVLLADQRRLDLSNATFTEAITRGGFDKVRDLSLRSMISTHYFNAGRYVRADDRVVLNYLHFRGVLAQAGLAPGDGDNADTLLSAIRRDRALVAEIKTQREFSLRQISHQSEFMASAVAVLNRLDARLGAPGSDQAILSQAR